MDQQPHHAQGVHGFLGDVEHKLEKFFAKAPFHIPEKWRHTIAKVSPWITLIVLILALPLILGALGLSIIAAPAIFASGHSYGAAFWIGWVIILASLILEAVALPQLFKLKIGGWRLVFWAYLLLVVSHIVTLDIVSLIGDVIGLYILFEIKNQYH